MSCLDSQYQLDRLSGRYIRTEDELNAQRSAYDLRPTEENQIDLWALGRQYDILGEGSTPCTGRAQPCRWLTALAMRCGSPSLA